MNRSTLLGIIGVAVAGSALALFMVWRGATPTAVPVRVGDPAVGSQTTGSDGPTVQASTPVTQPAGHPPQEGRVRPSDRPEMTAIDKQFVTSDSDFRGLAHEPLFDHIPPDGTADSTRRAMGEVLQEAAQFEADMRSIALTGPPEVAREALNRASIVYQRVGDALPPRPPAELNEAEAEAWVQDLEAQRIAMHEKARALLEEGME